MYKYLKNIKRVNFNCFNQSNIKFIKNQNLNTSFKKYSTFNSLKKNTLVLKFYLLIINKIKNKKIFILSFVFFENFYKKFKQDFIKDKKLKFLFEINDSISIILNFLFILFFNILFMFLLNSKDKIICLKFRIYNSNKKFQNENNTIINNFGSFVIKDFKKTKKSNKRLSILEFLKRNSIEFIFKNFFSIVLHFKSSIKQLHGVLQNKNSKYNFFIKNVKNSKVTKNKKNYLKFFCLKKKELFYFMFFQHLYYYINVLFHFYCFSFKKIQYIIIMKTFLIKHCSKQNPQYLCIFAPSLFRSSFLPSFLPLASASAEKRRSGEAEKQRSGGIGSADADAAASAAPKQKLYGHQRLPKQSPSCAAKGANQANSSERKQTAKFFNKFYLNNNIFFLFNNKNLLNNMIFEIYNRVLFLNNYFSIFINLKYKPFRMHNLVKSKTLKCFKLTQNIYNIKLLLKFQKIFYCIEMTYVLSKKKFYNKTKKFLFFKIQKLLWNCFIFKKKSFLTLYSIIFSKKKYFDLYSHFNENILEKESVLSIFIKKKLLFFHYVPQPLAKSFGPFFYKEVCCRSFTSVKPPLLCFSASPLASASSEPMPMPLPAKLRHRLRRSERRSGGIGSTEASGRKEGRKEERRSEGISSTEAEAKACEGVEQSKGINNSKFASWHASASLHTLHVVGKTKERLCSKRKQQNDCKLINMISNNVKKSNRNLEIILGPLKFGLSFELYCNILSYYTFNSFIKQSIKTIKSNFLFYDCFNFYKKKFKNFKNYSCSSFLMFLKATGIEDSNSLCFLLLFRVMKEQIKEAICSSSQKQTSGDRKKERKSEALKKILVKKNIVYKLLSKKQNLVINNQNFFFVLKQLIEILKQIRPFKFILHLKRYILFTKNLKNFTFFNIILKAFYPCYKPSNFVLNCFEIENYLKSKIFFLISKFTKINMSFLKKNYIYFFLSELKIQNNFLAILLYALLLQYTNEHTQTNSIISNYNRSKDVNKKILNSYNQKEKNNKKDKNEYIKLYNIGFYYGSFLLNFNINIFDIVDIVYKNFYISFLKIQKPKLFKIRFIKSHIRKNKYSFKTYIINLFKYKFFKSVFKKLFLNKKIKKKKYIKSILSLNIKYEKSLKNKNFFLYDFKKFFFNNCFFTIYKNFQINKIQNKSKFFLIKKWDQKILRYQKTSIYIWKKNKISFFYEKNYLNIFYNSKFSNCLITDKNNIFVLNSKNSIINKFADATIAWNTKFNRSHHLISQKKIDENKENIFYLKKRKILSLEEIDSFKKNGLNFKGFFLFFTYVSNTLLDSKKQIFNTKESSIIDKKGCLIKKQILILKNHKVQNFHQFFFCCMRFCFTSFESSSQSKIDKPKTQQKTQYLKFKINAGLIPSKKNLKKHLNLLKNIILKYNSQVQKKLLYKLSYRIMNWSYYYKIVTNSQLFYYSDKIIYKLLWKWACRNHPNKSKKWIQQKYFFSLKNKKWVFGILPKNFDSKSSKKDIFYLPFHNFLIKI